MGRIRVEGLGVVEIAGDTPTPDEERAIADALNESAAKAVRVDQVGQTLRDQVGAVVDAVSSRAQDVVHGFNQAVPFISEPIRMLAGKPLEAMYGNEPQTAGERVARSAGNMLGLTLPTAMGMQGLANLGVAAGPAANAIQRGASSLLDAYRAAPGAAAAVDTVGALGAGTGGGIAGEVAPGNDTARMVGEFAGGMAPMLSPAGAVAKLGGKALSIAKNTLSNEAATARATDYVAGQLQGELSSDMARKALQRASEVKQEIPGYSPSLAEATQTPSLIATQREIEKRAQGPVLDAAVERRATNEAAIQKYAEAQAPGLPMTPDALQAEMDRRVATLRGKLASQADAATAKRDQIERSRTGVQKSIETERQRIAQQGQDAALSTANRRIELQDQEIAIRDQAALIDQQKLEAMRRADDAIAETRSQIGAQFGRIDREAIGGRLRENVIAKREAVKSALGQTLRSIGLADVDMTPQFRQFAETVKQRFRAESRFTDPAQDHPIIGKIIREVGGQPPSAGAAKALDALSGQVGEGFLRDAKARVAGAPAAAEPQPTTLNDIKELREYIGEEIRQAISGPRRNAQTAQRLVELRQVLDEQLLNPNALGAEGDAVSAYRKWLNAYREDVIDPFERKAPYEVRKKGEAGFFRTEDEEVAATFLESESSARQFQRLFQNDPQALADVEAVALDDLATVALRNGELSPAAVETWWANKEKTLRNIPSAYRRLEGIVGQVRAAEGERLGMQRAVEDRAREAKAALEAERQAIGREKIAATRALTDQRAATQEQTRDLAGFEERQLAQLDAAMQPVANRIATLKARQDKLERSILARRLSAIDQGNSTPEQLIDQAIERPQVMMRLMGGVRGNAQAEGGLKRAVWDRAANLQGAQLRDFLDKHDASLRILLGKKHLDALNFITDARLMAEAVPMPTGKAIEPDMLERFKSLTGVNPSAAMARYLAVSRGRSSRAVESFTGIMNFFRERGRITNERLLSEAIYNPEVADALMTHIVGYKPTKETHRRLRAWLYGLGVTGEQQQEGEQ